MAVQHMNVHLEEFGGCSVFASIACCGQFDLPNAPIFASDLQNCCVASISFFVVWFEFVLVFCIWMCRVISFKFLVSLCRHCRMWSCCRERIRCCKLFESMLHGESNPMLQQTQDIECNAARRIKSDCKKVESNVFHGESKMMLQKNQT